MFYEEITVRTCFISIFLYGIEISSGVIAHKLIPSKNVKILKLSTLADF